MMPTKTSPASKTLPGEKAERLRPERAARKARNLALAFYIDSLIRSGKIRDLAAVARMSGVSRATVSQLLNLLDLPLAEQDRLLEMVLFPR